MCAHIIGEKGLRLRLAVVDHIASATAIMYPVARINSLIKRRSPSTLILTDGAHALGQVSIELTALYTDFYVSSLHKWFLAPRGCAFLWLRDAKQHAGFRLQPNYISHGYRADTNYNFYRRGSTDKSSWFVVNECVRTYTTRYGGLERIASYNSALLAQAVDLLVRAWHTGKMEIAAELEAPFMKMVKLPPINNYELNRDDPRGSEVCAKLMKDLLDKYQIIVLALYIKSQMYVRVTCYVYNQIEDYMALRDAVNDLNK